MISLGLWSKGPRTISKDTHPIYDILGTYYSTLKYNSRDRFLFKKVKVISQNLKKAEKGSQYIMWVELALLGNTQNFLCFV